MTPTFEDPSFLNFSNHLFQGYMSFWQNLTLEDQKRLATQIEQGVHTLKQGELLAFPTETVYGLGAVISEKSAVQKIYQAKNRPAYHPLIVHVPIGFAVEKYAKVTPLAEKLMAAFWPGPVTLILEKTAAVIDEITGGQNSVGLRCPDHAIAQAVLRAVNEGVAAPSANRFGRISPTQYHHVCQEFEGQPLNIIDGDCLPPQVGIESTIIDARGETPVILRAGMLSLAEILNRLNLIDTREKNTSSKVDQTDLELPLNININPSTKPKNDYVHEVTKAQNSQTPPHELKVSGALASHYAPLHRLYLLNDLWVEMLLQKLTSDLHELKATPKISARSNLLKNLQSESESKSELQSPWVFVLRESSYKYLQNICQVYFNHINNFNMMENINQIQPRLLPARICSLPDDIYAYAHDLYATLRQADDLLSACTTPNHQTNPDFWQQPAIFWQPPIEHPLNVAINDRLNKAAYHTAQEQHAHGKKIEDVLKLIQIQDFLH